jgi:radical SAM superfamily enzyme YgiQ (UPF0313 family)
MLDAAGLPALAAEREDGHPLVVGGGALAMMNPEPLAAFFDLFLIGEAEVLLEPFLRVWGELRSESRAAMTRELAKLAGSYAPALSAHKLWTRTEGGLRADEQMNVGIADGATNGAVSPIQTVETVKWTDAAHSMTSGRLPREAQFRESVLVELARGCTRRCRFCLAGHIYLPLRARPAERVIAEARTSARAGETIGLLALCAGDYRELGPLTSKLRAMGLRIAISSLPPDFTGREAAQQIVRSGTTTLTIAPETGSDRLRAGVGKRVTNERILETVRLLGAAGVRHLRTYFLIGLPFETRADILAIVTLLREMRGELPLSATLTATVNAFVPKPRTPFERQPMAAPEALREAGGWIARAAPWGVRMRIKSFREARLQAALSRGDARWGGRLLRIARRNEPLAAIVKEEGWSLSDLTGRVADDADTPWDFLIDARERRSLRREWRLAVKAARGENVEPNS